MGTAPSSVLSSVLWCWHIPPDRATELLHIAGGEHPIAPHVDTFEIPAADPYAVQADAFSRAIRTGDVAPISPSDSAANLEVIEAIFAAGEPDLL